ncbi:MAG: hypothetical protein EOO62_27865 [Hymenobacter sp.]|nr:MAG: hypothetical protein EOO62_27865 [Hymenobacter sp.]
MLARLFTTSAVSFLLLLGALSCSKKDAPTATTTNTGTYTLDGVITPCQVAVSALSGTANNLIADYLDVQLTPTDPQHSGEVVFLYFDKPLNAPTSAYELLSIKFASSLPPLPYAINYTAPDATATLSQLSSGGYSGTFAAPFSRFSSRVITAGAFIDARP